MFLGIPAEQSLTSNGMLREASLFMLHIHTNQWQAMKGIVQRNQTDYAFHDPIQSHFAFNNENHLFSL